MTETSAAAALGGGQRACAERRKIDPPVAGHRHPLDRGGRKPAARQHRGVLDRGHQQALARRRFRRGSASTGESASMLASVPPEVNTTLRGSAPTSAATLLARLLDQAARGAALGMDRGRIAGDLERGHGGGARLRPQRRGRIPVEINSLGHGL